MSQERKLGEPLSINELSTYLTIHNSGEKGLSLNDLCKQIYGDSTNVNVDGSVLISRIFYIQQKLGLESIIFKRSKDGQAESNKYFSSRALIEAKVGKNRSKSMG